MGFSGFSTVFVARHGFFTVQNGSNQPTFVCFVCQAALKRLFSAPGEPDGATESGRL